MSRKIKPTQQQEVPRSRAGRLPFRVSTVTAAVIVALNLLGSGSLYAADESTVAELKAEIARLKAELAVQKGTAAAPAANSATVAEPTPANSNAVTASAGDAQTLDAVVIRSRNRIERLQDVPLSVSVVTGKELERLGAADMGAIVKRAANVSWNQGNQRTSSLSIRGVGKIGQLEAMDPSVGLIVDGVSYAFNPISSSYNFTDVDTVEVTRGPQGTLLGKNTSLGVINVTTKRPSFTPSADYSVTIGQRDKIIGSFAAGGPITDGLLAYRANLSVEKGAGDIVNVYAYAQDRTYTNTDRATGRVQFLLTPSPDFTARFELNKTPNGGEYTNTRVFNTPTPTRYANGAANGLTNDVRIQRRWFAQNTSYNYANNYLSQSELNIDGGYPLVTGNNGATAELNWNLGEHTLSSITAYKDYHFNAKNDDGTPFAISTTGGVHDNYRQLSQELRLSSKPGGFVDYQTGLFLIDTKVSYTSYTNWLQDAGAWNATNAQYNTLDVAGLLAGGVANGGRDLLINSVNGMFKKVVNNIENRAVAVFGQANWHLSDAATLTTGLRLTSENRKDPSSTLIINNGTGAELNPVSLPGGGGRVVQFSGGFGSSTAAATLGQLTAAALADPVQVANANRLAQKYFGVATYEALTAPQLAQVAAAKALRQTAIGSVFNLTEAERFKKVQPNFVVSPSYKINEDLTTYVSWQYGEKAGISQVVAGESQLAKPEKTNAYELGFKSALLNKTLIFNADIFLMNIKDYQQSVRLPDLAASTPGNPVFFTLTGNAPKVQAKGVEVDGVYAGIPNTTVRFSGAYTDTRYKDFKNSAQPVESANLTTPADLTGKTLAGAAKVTWNVGAEYRIPVLGTKEFHVDFNTAYTSRYNSDVALSDYAWIPANYLTDFGIGIGTLNKSFDVSLLVKNLFDDKTHISESWNSYGPATSRWIGLVFKGKL